MQVGTILLGAGALAGAMIAAQGVVNGRMAEHMGGPLQAAIISFSVGWLALLGLNLALGHTLPVGAALREAPWWAWIGGPMGAIVVSLAATAVPRIGVAAYVSAFLAGQLRAPPAPSDLARSFLHSVRPSPRSTRHGGQAPLPSVQPDLEANWAEDRPDRET